MDQSATLTFRGRFRPDSFLDFVHHRADRLALRAGIGIARPDYIEVSVVGPEELIDAFEVACTLGPIDCLVLEHSRVANDAGCPPPRKRIGGSFGR
jgi:hypothetical protein